MPATAAARRAPWHHFKKESADYNQSILLHNRYENRQNTRQNISKVYASDNKEGGTLSAERGGRQMTPEDIAKHVHRYAELMRTILKAPAQQDSNACGSYDIEVDCRLQGSGTSREHLHSRCGVVEFRDASCRQACYQASHLPVPGRIHASLTILH
jgi:hypothetical protein